MYFVSVEASTYGDTRGRVSKPGGRNAQEEREGGRSCELQQEGRHDCGIRQTRIEPQRKRCPEVVPHEQARDHRQAERGEQAEAIGPPEAKHAPPDDESAGQKLVDDNGKRTGVIEARSVGEAHRHDHAHVGHDGQQKRIEALDERHTSGDPC